MDSNKKLINSVLVLFLSIFSAFWILKNLDLCLLWQDEAETACVSRTVLTEGIPKGFDGLNHFSQQEGREYGPNYEWKLHPWFQFYWTAASFAVFGQSTWSARFPFALLGIFTVLLSFFLAKRLWKDDKTAWFLAALFLSNIFFLLLVRQVRYYAPVMFFSVYGLWALQDLIENKKIGYLHYIMASLLLFQSQYLFCIVFWIGSLGYVFLFHRPILLSVLVSTGIAALPSIPFLIWILDTPYGETLTQVKEQKGVLHGLGIFGYHFFYYVLQPQWVIAFIVFVFFRKQLAKAADFNWKEEHFSLFLLLLIGGNLLALSLLVPEYYTRYICSVIPFGLLLLAAIARQLSKIHWGFPWGIWMITLVFMGDMANYTEELKQTKFVGPIDGFVNFLTAKAGKEAKVAISFGDLPLKFYTPNKIYGGLAGDLPENLDSIDVIIIRYEAIHTFDEKVRDRLVEYLEKNTTSFQAASVPIEDSPFQNRETPKEHYYKTLKVQNPITVHYRIKN